MEATEEDLVHFIERHAMSREIGVGNKEGAQDITEQYIQPNTYLSDKRGQEEQILEIWHPFRAAIQSGSSSAGSSTAAPSTLPSCFGTSLYISLSTLPESTHDAINRLHKFDSLNSFYTHLTNITVVSTSICPREIMANAPHNDLDDDLFHTRDTFKKKPRRKKFRKKTLLDVYRRGLHGDNLEKKKEAAAEEETKTAGDWREVLDGQATLAPGNDGQASSASKLAKSGEEGAATAGSPAAQWVPPILKGVVIPTAGAAATPAPAPAVEEAKKAIDWREVVDNQIVANSHHDVEVPEVTRDVMLQDVYRAGLHDDNREAKKDTS
ncbi:MAG: hypothetical protein LQ350_008713 [Teloschistes chrysophthalmus]|nr:MAG: hypothetical protein LQ350_008713 [Niorma chrysophthalma]